MPYSYEKKIKTSAFFFLQFVCLYSVIYRSETLLFIIKLCIVYLTQRTAYLYCQMNEYISEKKIFEIIFTGLLKKKKNVILNTLRNNVEISI